MSQLIQLELDEAVIGRAREVAVRTGQPLETVLQEWIGNAAENIPVELLPDEQVIALAEMTLSEPDQAALSNLLEDQREGSLDAAGQRQLDALMGQYRRGWVRKAQAIKVAVQRGLLPLIG